MTVNYIRWLRSYVGHQRLLQLAASAFIRDDRGSVLLGRRADVMLWAPPSGVVQLGETPVRTIVREVQEETGLHIQVERLIGLYTGTDFEWTYPNGDQAQIVSAFFACGVVGGRATRNSRGIWPCCRSAGWSAISGCGPTTRCSTTWATARSTRRSGGPCSGFPAWSCCTISCCTTSCSTTPPRCAATSRATGPRRRCATAPRASASRSSCSTGASSRRRSICRSVRAYWRPPMG